MPIESKKMRNEEIVRLRRLGFSLVTLANMFGISKQRVHAILKAHSDDDDQR